ASSVLAQEPTPSSGPKIWLQDRQPLTMQESGARQWLQDRQPLTMQESGARLRAPGGNAALPAQPVAMASGDLDGDGIPELVVGYSTGAGGYISIQRGNLDAFAPQSDASFQAIGRGEFPSPFLPQAQKLSVPVRPD